MEGIFKKKNLPINSCCWNYKAKEYLHNWMKKLREDPTGFLNTSGYKLLCFFVKTALHKSSVQFIW